MLRFASRASLASTRTAQGRRGVRDAPLGISKMCRGRPCVNLARVAGGRTSKAQRNASHAHAVDSRPLARLRIRGADLVPVGGSLTNLQAALASRAHVGPFSPAKRRHLAIAARRVNFKTLKEPLPGARCAPSDTSPRRRGRRDAPLALWASSRIRKGKPHVRCVLQHTMRMLSGVRIAPPAPGFHLSATPARRIHLVAARLLASAPAVRPVRSKQLKVHTSA